MSAERGGGYAGALGLTGVLSVGAAVTLIAAAVLIAPPQHAGLSPQTAAIVNTQNQTAKTLLYLGGFFVLLPAALLVGSRLADRIAAAGGEGAPASLAAVLTAALAGILIVIRVSAGLPWGDGLKAVLVGSTLWWVLALAALVRASRGSWTALRRLRAARPLPEAAAAGLVFGLLLAMTSGRSLGALPLVLGAAAAALVLAAAERVRRAAPAGPRPLRLVLEAVLLILVFLAIPDTVVFEPSRAIPNAFFDPGIVQFQHDYILGPTNQLLGGGALLVGDPVSQYGVGMIYFLAGVFHLAPIGYGTFGLLDGVLTALFYLAGYLVLRLSGVRPLLAGSALVLAVLAFVYNMTFFVGQLPEEGPLRFGLPMLVVLGAVIAARGTRRAETARVLALVALAVSAVWALEAFVYTAFTFAAVSAVEAWLLGPARRVRAFIGRAALGVGVCLAAHALLALATLAATGQLPHWGQYLGYLREFLFGGSAGSISYGFATWGPALAVYAGALLSAAGLVLLVLRAPAHARARPAALVALAGTTAYEIAILSYTDNRSATYILVYVALPLLLAAVLWLSLLLEPRSGASRAARRGALAGGLAVAVLLFAGAWPAIGTHFSRSALAHARPGGDLGGRLSRLWHPPPIDPRARAGERLLAGWIPGHRALVLLPTASDLGLEILMRSRRSNLLPIGDPKADSLVESVWLPRMLGAVAGLRAGTRMLIDETALQVIAAMRSRAVNPLTARIDKGQTEVEWILHRLDQRFRFRTLARGPSGLIVAELAPKGRRGRRTAKT